MPKFPPYESAIHHFLLQARRIAEIERLLNPSTFNDWQRFVLSFQFEKLNATTISVRWTFPTKGQATFSFGDAQYYTRGDTREAVRMQKSHKLLFKEDQIKIDNDQLYFTFVSKIAKHAGFQIDPKNTPHIYYDGRSIKRFYDEEHLSDEWAKSIDVKKIDVVKMNESCTAPEIRYIMKRLGSIKGKSLLDVGCGLGEASVYFAMKGARVMAMDISHFMTDTALALARENDVTIETHQSSIEHFSLAKHKRFDIIYVGNLFHHVDIDKALERIVYYLKPAGVLVSWEPVAYNPVINVYRKIATAVRSRDERPIRIKDLKKFNKHFSHIETTWYWLTTLMIFIIMAFVLGRNPNRMRYWKTVVLEGDRWKWLYTPLEALDKKLLSLFPMVRFMCWNVVIIATKPKKI